MVALMTTSDREGSKGTRVIARRSHPSRSLPNRQRPARHPSNNDGRTVGDVDHLPSRRVQEGAHLVTEHALDLPSHRVQAYHVVSVVYSTLWFGYEDTAVRRDDVHA